MAALVKHRRPITQRATVTYDVQNDARCAHFGQRHCTSGLCPRHFPDAYADHSALHVSNVFGTGTISTVRFA